MYKKTKGYVISKQRLAMNGHSWAADKDKAANQAQNLETDFTATTNEM